MDRRHAITPLCFRTIHRLIGLLLYIKYGLMTLMASRNANAGGDPKRLLSN